MPTEITKDQLSDYLDPEKLAITNAMGLEVPVICLACLYSEIGQRLTCNQEQVIPTIFEAYAKSEPDKACRNMCRKFVLDPRLQPINQNSIKGIFSSHTNPHRQ